jgi:hypothetical protein
MLTDRFSDALTYADPGRDQPRWPRCSVNRRQSPTVPDSPPTWAGSLAPVALKRGKS